jgi:hypothetical protein
VSKENFEKETKKSLVVCCCIVIISHEWCNEERNETAALRCGVGHDLDKNGTLAEGSFFKRKGISLIALGQAQNMLLAFG